MKSVIRVLMLGLLVGGFSLGLVACGGDETPPAVEETPTTEESPEAGVVEEEVIEEVVEETPEPADNEATPGATESPEGDADAGTSN